MSLDKPCHNIAERAVDVLMRIMEGETVPKGHFMGYRAYRLGAKAEKLAVPLRRLVLPKNASRMEER
ncbi:hypothetical protein I4J00_11250 [Corynebacterium diphtheriae bv. gravis]|uniref:hypothetical protein n=1 Tax=Corynebacterium diphtheriae TaxID=1717 RepID=UPI0013CBBA28|nr:hypothetical protein [Corynebacterium diphtheriae]MBG9297526.1 hypothetical protein [Corynebacterium diphtheriae bv. gravis]CAB0546269.1 hypothetical protein CIP107515_00841 [Corynebacterium diphtheriae]CAB1005724.1 hypothetical protein FRC0521_00780 [Corynebacterium diphtheriae]